MTLGRRRRTTSAPSGEAMFRLLNIGWPARLHVAGHCETTPNLPPWKNPDHRHQRCRCLAVRDDEVIDRVVDRNRPIELLTRPSYRFFVDSSGCEERRWL